MLHKGNGFIAPFKANPNNWDNVHFNVEDVLDKNLQLRCGDKVQFEVIEEKTKLKRVKAVAVSLVENIKQNKSKQFIMQRCNRGKQRP